MVYKYEIAGNDDICSLIFGINFEESDEVGSMEEILNTSPIYSLDLIAEDANWNYGPWANRQRILIQEYFYPVHYQPLVPEPKMHIGDTRKYKNLDISFKMTGQSSSLRIPFRDLSKVNFKLFGFNFWSTSMNLLHQSIKIISNGKQMGT